MAIVITINIERHPDSVTDTAVQIITESRVAIVTESGVQLVEES